MRSLQLRRERLEVGLAALHLADGCLGILSRSRLHRLPLKGVPLRSLGPPQQAAGSASGQGSRGNVRGLGSGGRPLHRQVHVGSKGGAEMQALRGP